MTRVIRPEAARSLRAVAFHYGRLLFQMPISVQCGTRLAPLANDSSEVLRRKLSVCTSLLLHQMLWVLQVIIPPPYGLEQCQLVPTGDPRALERVKLVVCTPMPHNFE